MRNQTGTPTVAHVNVYLFAFLPVSRQALRTTEFSRVRLERLRQRGMRRVRNLVLLNIRMMYEDGMCRRSMDFACLD